MYSDADKLACLERELMRRKRVYPNRVLTRRMSAREAGREIELMHQLIADYAAKVRKEAA